MFCTCSVINRGRLTTAPILAGCIFYEWNDLEAAEEHAQQSLHLARQYDRAIDRFIFCEVLLARLKLARGDAGAAAVLAAARGSGARTILCSACLGLQPYRSWCYSNGVTWQQPLISPRRTNSLSVRPGCTWPKGILARRSHGGAVLPADGSKGLAR